MADPESELSKEVAKLTKEVYEDVLKPTTTQAGAFLGDITEWLLQKTYSLKLGNVRRKLEFERNKKMLELSYASIPETKFIEPAPELFIPLLERLAITSNEDIAKLFINVLNKASNVDTIQEAHPAFVSMIERLSADEAKIINHLQEKTYLLFLYVDFVHHNSGKTLLSRTLTVLNDLEENNEPLRLTFGQNIPMYLDNLDAIGVISNIVEFIGSENKFSLIREIYKPEIEEIVSSFAPVDITVTFRACKVYITPFGKSFIKACTNS